MVVVLLEFYWILFFSDGSSFSSETKNCEAHHWISEKDNEEGLGPVTVDCCKARGWTFAN